jgi:hypothetical protein
METYLIEESYKAGPTIFYVPNSVIKSLENFEAQFKALKLQLVI